MFLFCYYLHSCFPYKELIDDFIISQASRHKGKGLVISMKQGNSLICFRNGADEFRNWIHCKEMNRALRIDIPLLGTFSLFSLRSFAFSRSWERKRILRAKTFSAVLCSNPFNYKFQFAHLRKKNAFPLHLYSKLR